MNTKAKQIKQTRNQNSYFAHLKIYIDIHLLKPSTHLTLYFHKTVQSFNRIVSCVKTFALWKAEGAKASFQTFVGRSFSCRGAMPFLFQRIFS